MDTTLNRATAVVTVTIIADTLRKATLVVGLPVGLVAQVDPEAERGSLRPLVLPRELEVEDSTVLRPKVDMVVRLTTNTITKVATVVDMVMKVQVGLLLLLVHLQALVETLETLVVTLAMVVVVAVVALLPHRALHLVGVSACKYPFPTSGGGQRR